MGKKQVKRELEKPDEFLKTVGHVGKFFNTHGREIVFGLIAVLVGWAAFIAWQAWDSKKNQAVADSFEEIMDRFPADPTPGIGEEAEKVTWEAFALELESFLAENGRSSSAPMARLYLGRAYLETGNNPKALEMYTSVAKDLSKPYAYLAEEGKGLALMELEKWGEAKESFTQLSQAEDNPMQSLHTWQLGVVQEVSGDTEGAIQTYQAFAKKFAGSALLEKVQLRLSLLQQGS